MGQHSQSDKYMLFSSNIPSNIVNQNRTNIDATAFNYCNLQLHLVNAFGFIWTLSMNLGGQLIWIELRRKIKYRQWWSDADLAWAELYDSVNFISKCHFYMYFSCDYMYKYVLSNNTFSLKTYLSLAKSRTFIFPFRSTLCAWMTFCKCETSE